MSVGDSPWVVHNQDQIRSNMCPNVFVESGRDWACCCLTPDQVAAFDARLERERERQRKPAA